MQVKERRGDIQLQVDARSKISPQSAPVPFQHDNSSDDASDDGSNEEAVPMIEKEFSSQGRRRRGMPSVVIATLCFLLLVSGAGNVVLLWGLLQVQDLDAISLKHTSEYCK